MDIYFIYRVIIILRNINLVFLGLIIFLFICGGTYLLNAQLEQPVVLEEILTLNWGYGNEDAGCVTKYSIQDIAAITGFRYGPSDFFIDSNENVYILDKINYRVLVFKNQKLLHTYYYDKSLDTQYGRISVDNSGNLYITFNSLNKQKVIKYNMKNNIEATYLSVSNPRLASLDIKIDKYQNIYFLSYTDSEMNRYSVKKYSKDNKFIEEFFIEEKVYGSLNNWEVDEKGVIYFLSISADDIPEMYCCKSDKIDILYSLNKKNDRNYLNFLGIDKEYNFYFYKNIRKYYFPGEEDKIEGIIVSKTEVIIAHQGLIIYKYNSGGDLLKEVKIDDPTPYDIKMNSKGNIYLTPVLATEALLVVPLDKYRIYKFTM